jgi:hypothetical protein
VPFTYLDFDRNDFTIQRPLTILAEILAQLAVQYPTQAEYVREARDELVSPDRESYALESMGDRELGVGHVLAVLRAVDMQDAPFLLVLDTFEEVQYASASYLKSLWELLSVLQNAIPHLAIVIAGRAPLEDPSVATWFTPATLHLAGFDRTDALQFLTRLGITDARVAGAIIDAVGTIPLSLRLAADLYRRNPDLQQFSNVGALARDVQIQGQLYHRVLGAIHDPDVRKLAHPGLVLRFVSPDLIARVLAGPCQLELPRASSADELFARLARETALVTRAERDGEAVLNARTDVRRMMLKMLCEDDPQRTQAIHRAAIAYFEARTSVADRAEEIYHRLCADEDAATVDARWIDGLSPHLVNALPDLPAEQRVYLASRLGVDLGDAERREADHASWERDTAKKVAESLRVGRRELIEQALVLLHERPERNEGTPLRLLEAHVLEKLERLDEARALAEAALPAARRHGGRTLVETLLTCARLDEALQRPQEAARWLGDALAALDDEAVETKIEIGLRRVDLLKRSRADHGDVIVAQGDLVSTLETSRRRSEATTQATLIAHAARLPKAVLDGLGIRVMMVVDSFPFPFANPMAQELHRGLSSAFPSEREAMYTAETYGISPADLPTGLSARNLWHEILRRASAQGVLREMVEGLRADPSVAALHPIFDVALGRAVLPPQLDRTAVSAALLEAFPQREDLDVLVSIALREKLADIAPVTGSHATTVHEVVRWAEQHLRLEKLVAHAFARRSTPRLVELANQLPATEKVASRWLSPSLMDELWRALLALGLDASSSELFAGVDTTALRRIFKIAREQLTSDLETLNMQDSNKDLRRLLHNARALAGERKEKAVFEKALADLAER